MTETISQLRQEYPGLDKVYKDLGKIERRRVVATVSGGPDCVAAAYLMRDAGFEVDTLFFDWGQKTVDKERKCAQAIANELGATFKEVEVPMLKQLGGITLTQKDTMTRAINEYVPARNFLFWGQATAYAESCRAGAVSVGSLGGDHNCPDNSPAFTEAIQEVINIGTMLQPRIRLVAPFGWADKIQAVRVGMALGVRYDLTWSCHNNTEEACGECSNCEARQEAFEKNGAVDPIPYVK